MTNRSWMIAKSLGLRGILVIALGFWVAAIILSRRPRDTPSPGADEVDTYFGIIMSGN